MSLSTPSATSLWIGATFLLLAGWFFWDSGTRLPEIPAQARVDASEIDPSPMRPLFSDPPTLEVGGYQQSCSECHRLFESQPDVSVTMGQHQDIVLDHGLNDRCLNCHSTKDRDKLILHGEKEIGYDQVVQLCAKCHGPTFRDWERGMHGRTAGHWDVAYGPQTRLACTQCHDPHAPAFPSLEPLPAPNTLRMGEPPSDVHAPDPAKESPLLKRIHSPEAAAASSHSEHAEEERP